MLKVAVFLESRLDAGANRYELTIARLLHAQQSKTFSFVFVVPDEASRQVLDAFGVLPVLVLKESLPKRLHRVASRSMLGFRVLKAFRLHRNDLDRLLADSAVDLVYFLGPSYRCRDLAEHSFVLTVWDLNHRDGPDFPEVGASREFEVREQLYSNYLKKAFAVSVDSHLGRANIIRRYGLDEDKVHVLPFLPPNVLKEGDAPVDVRTKFGIKGRYVFYPAQFWSHKNHIYILDALRLLRDDHGVSIQAVFTGADKGNLKYILAKAKEYGLEGQVRHLGFVDAIDLDGLYKHAVALVMPTYFGPTNLPPLEAFSLGCPVCYPAHAGIDNYIEDAVFSIDLEDPNSLVKHLLTIESQPAAVAAKLESGRRLLDSWTESDFWRRVESILGNFAKRRRTRGRL